MCRSGRRWRHAWCVGRRAPRLLEGSVQLRRGRRSKRLSPRLSTLLLGIALMLCLLLKLLVLALFLVVLLLLFQSLLLPLVCQLHPLLLLFPLQLFLLLIQFLSLLLLLLPLQLELQVLLLPPLLFLLMLLLLHLMRRVRNTLLRRITAGRRSAQVDTPISLVPRRCLPSGATHRGREAATVTGRPRIASRSTAAVTAAAAAAATTDTTIPGVGIIGVQLPAERKTHRRPRWRHVVCSRGLLPLLLLLLLLHGLRLLYLLRMLCWRLLRPADAKRRVRRLRQAATPTRRRRIQSKGMASLYGCPSRAAVSRLAATDVALRCRRVAIPTGCIGRRRRVTASPASRAHPRRLGRDGWEEGKAVRRRQRQGHGAPKIRRHPAAAAAATATTRNVWRHAQRGRSTGAVLTTTIGPRTAKRRRRVPRRWARRVGQKLGMDGRCRWGSRGHRRGHAPQVP